MKRKKVNILVYMIVIHRKKFAVIMNFLQATKVIYLSNVTVVITISGMVIFGYDFVNFNSVSIVYPAVLYSKSEYE